MGETNKQVPVTVLTGFLGAGKTTLLNRILTEQHGRKYAVIVNEFGEQGIDNDLVVDADEEVFEMNNGCICCTVRGDLIRILSGLMKRADKLDAIIVETTGLADPAPVAQTFFVDQDVADRTKLDAIVTVADAVHLSSQIGEHHEAEEQIAFADVVLLNKIDLVKDKEIDDRWRGFGRPVSARNLANDVDDVTVDALAEAVTSRMPDIAHRYYQMKAEWMGVKQLNWWDRNAPLPGDDDRRFSWNEAQDIVMSAFGSFDDVLVAAASLLLALAMMLAVPAYRQIGTRLLRL